MRNKFNGNTYPDPEHSLMTYRYFFSSETKGKDAICFGLWAAQLPGAADHGCHIKSVNYEYYDKTNVVALEYQLTQRRSFSWLGLMLDSLSEDKRGKFGSYVLKRQ